MHAMTAAQTAENHGDEWEMNWYSQCGIYSSVPTWTLSQNLAIAAEAPYLKISSLEHFPNDHKVYPNSHKNSEAVWWKGTPLFEFEGNSVEP